MKLILIRIGGIYIPRKFYPDLGTYFEKETAPVKNPFSGFFANALLGEKNKSEMYSLEGAECDNRVRSVI